MKTNFKKSLAVFMALLMLFSVFSVSVFAATEYTVTYKPGTGVEGEEVVDTYTKSYKYRPALFTRPHYKQIGWAETDGGVKKYNFNASRLQKKSIVLYPAWEGDVYTITYAPGQYATSGSVVTDSANYGASKALKGEIFFRDGYVQTGWALEDGGEKVYDLNVMSNPIEGDTTLYPYWAQLWNIKFAPGEFGVGGEVVEIVEGGQTFSTKDAIFTREGYQHVGWSLTDGGEKVYNLSQNYIPAEGDVTLYPYWLKNVYSITVSENSLYYGDVCEGYVALDGEADDQVKNSIGVKGFKVKNTGNIPVTVYVSPLSNYDMSSSGMIDLAVGAEVEILVRPKAGLTKGEYNEELGVVIVEDTTVYSIVSLEFSVGDHVLGRATSNGDATYAKDGTKTATCVKGCGYKVSDIPDEGSMKEYGAEYNDAVGLVPQYVHHRTVRFTAYGSGTDDYERTIGKRYVPISWHVNDEFNGKFDDGNYDVAYTHSIYGKYTLTINYVEEQYDDVTKEWTATGETDVKTFNYTVGATAYEQQEIETPKTILNVIFGLFKELFALLGIAK